MTTAILCAALVIAVAAAARSTWSPCGLSMLSTITPWGERARRHRYWVTAGWFLIGAVAGGATLGGVAAAMAGLLGWAGDPGRFPHAVIAVAAVLAAMGAAVDSGLLGPVLPLIVRQVDDRWLSRYRPWAYGVGFGWQIGVGLATYLMTAGVVVVALLAALTGSPGNAVIAGVCFGGARGLTVFLTARCHSPASLRALHERLDRLGGPVRWAVVGAQAGAALGLTLLAAGALGYGGAPGALAPLAGGVVVGSLVAAPAALHARLRRRLVGAAG